MAAHVWQSLHHLCAHQRRNQLGPEPALDGVRGTSFYSADEIANKRNPARFMRWNERKHLLNQLNGGFLLDGKVGRLSRKVSFQSILTVGGMGTESYFGGMDLDTARNISGRLGSAFHLDWFKPSQGLHEKPLLRPDELIRLEDNDLLVLHANRDPLRLRTVPYYQRGDLHRSGRIK